MLARMRKAVSAARQAQTNPIAKAAKLGPMLEDLERGLVEGINAIESIAAVVYVVARQAGIAAEELQEIRAIVDPEKLPEVKS